MNREESEQIERLAEELWPTATKPELTFLREMVLPYRCSIVEVVFRASREAGEKLDLHHVAVGLRVMRQMGVAQ